MIDKTVSFLQALVINILLIAVLIISMEWVKPEEPLNFGIMEAIAVDERVFQTAFQQMEKETKRRKAIALMKQQAIEEQQTSLETEKMRLAQLEIEEIDRKQREAEEQRRKAEEQRLAQIAFERAERLRKQKEAQEARRRTEENRRKKEAQAELERQRKEEAKRQVQEKIIQEKQRQAASEQEKKRQAEAKKQADLDRKKREEAEKSRRQAEQAARKQAEERRQAESARERQKQQDEQACPDNIGKSIEKKVKGYWVEPPGSGHLSCSVRGYLLPGGKVGKVYISNSSGNSAFDSSALRAVYDASPFLVPPSAFQACKDINVNFIPKP